LQRGSPHVHFPPAPRRFRCGGAAVCRVPSGDGIRHAAAELVVEKLETKLVLSCSAVRYRRLPAWEGARSLFGSVASPQLSLRRAAISVHIEQRRGVLADSRCTSPPRGVPREGRSRPESRPPLGRLLLGQNSFLSGCMPIKRRCRPCRPHRLFVANGRAAPVRPCGLVGARRSQTTAGLPRRRARAAYHSRGSAPRADESVWRRKVCTSRL
jgi:hypothetical protein